MLIGHYGPALLIQSRKKNISLWALFIAVQLVDVLWGVFILCGLEHARIVPGFTESNALDLYDMPYTHSLVATLGWGAVVAVAWGAMRRSSTRWLEGVLVGLAVASHFVGDLIVHVRDLPILGSDGEKWGLGLWRHRELALVVELAFFVVPALMWLRASWQPAATSGRRTTLIGVMTFALIVSFYIPTPPAPWAMALTSFSIYVAMARFAAWASPAVGPRRGSDTGLLAPRFSK